LKYYNPEIKGGKMNRNSCYILKREHLAPWVEKIMGEEDVLAPVLTSEGKFAFEYLKNAKDLRLDYPTTALPPTQKVFMPDGEVVVSWKKVDGRTVFEPAPAPKRLNVFGMHPYDIHALKIWDDVMGLGRGNLADPDYVAKRKNTAIIGLDVLAPPPNSFCESLGTHIALDGYDIMLTDLGDAGYFAEVATMKGLAVFFLVSDWEAATENDFVLRAKLRAEVAKKYPKTLPVPAEKIREFLEERILHPYFEKTGALCVGCAKCTIACPTCTCCNLKEEPALDGKSGSRVRECDSCQLKCFTKMAGGAFARKTPGERVRHRILDKFVYDHGMPASCVGCGRCVGVCPADIADPVKALTLLKEEVPHE